MCYGKKKNSNKSDRLGPIIHLPLANYVILDKSIPAP